MHILFRVREGRIRCHFGKCRGDEAGEKLVGSELRKAVTNSLLTDVE
jgi:hypothetical protein